MLKKILQGGSFIQLSLRPIKKRSSEIISFLLERLYYSSNPVGYAILGGIILGALMFLLKEALVGCFRVFYDLLSKR
jgi:hypothetical protein